MSETEGGGRFTDSESSREIYAKGRTALYVRIRDGEHPRYFWRTRLGVIVKPEREGRKKDLAHRRGEKGRGETFPRRPEMEGDSSPRMEEGEIHLQPRKTLILRKMCNSGERLFNLERKGQEKETWPAQEGERERGKLCTPVLGLSTREGDISRCLSSRVQKITGRRRPDSKVRNP